jgi:hypothetical protein
MKNKVVYIIILIVLVILGIIFLFPSKYTNNLKQVKIERTNQIYNATNNTSVDTIYRKGLETLDIKNEKFIITKFNGKERTIFNEEIKLRGAVIEKDGYYFIKTDLGSNKNIIDIASHELIHVKQMVNGNFKITDKGIYYKGKFYKLPLEVKYEDLPWEKEAYKESIPLLKIMKDSLLQKR